MDHFVHALGQDVRDEQVKAVSTAIRAETTLNKHMAFVSERRNMTKAMNRAKLFAKGKESF